MGDVCVCCRRGPMDINLELFGNNFVSTNSLNLVIRKIELFLVFMIPNQTCNPQVVKTTTGAPTHAGVGTCMSGCGCRDTCMSGCGCRDTCMSGCGHRDTCMSGCGHRDTCMSGCGQRIECIPSNRKLMHILFMAGGECCGWCRWCGW